MQTFEPRPYQKLMLKHILRRPRCAVWAGMGMGKTSGTLNALDALSLTDKVFPALVIAPKRVAQTTWPDEVKKWKNFSHLKVSPIIGKASDRRAALRMPADIFTINYENLPWLIEHLDGEWPFKVVVADEATKLKGFRLRQGTARARALAKVCWLHVERFIELTGTPSPNGLKDLWGQIWFLDKGKRLGRTFSDFERRWFVKDYTGYNILPRDNAQEEIQAVLKDLCLTLDPADWFDLREPIHNKIFIDLPMPARRAYKEMEEEMFTVLAEDGEVLESFNAAARTLKCLQLANGAAYTGENNERYSEVHDGKIEALREVMEEAGGVPIMVAYHFRSDLDRLLRAFPMAKHLDSDPRTIKAWNKGKIPLLLAHPASAGHGLNLQDGGNILVFFGHWWNLEEYQQIIERIGPVRQLQAGHNRAVFIHHLVARDTVDEMILARRESKRAVQDILMEAMKVRHG